jgi:hypothetical protein
MRFSEFAPLHERKVDPHALQQRVARRYGKKSKEIGNWDPVIKGKYIPLKGYNANRYDAFYQHLYKLRNALGLDDKNPEVRDAAKQKFDALYTHTSFPINELLPTQPFNRYEDDAISQEKLRDTSPKVIVVKFRNRFLISDGHHAVMAAKMRGEKTINAKFLDLDAALQSLKNQ